MDRLMMVYFLQSWIFFFRFYLRIARRFYQLVVELNLR